MLTVGAICGAIALFLAEYAQADRVVVWDPNDIAGPIDIASARHGHAGSDAVTGTVRTYGWFSSRRLRGENGIALALSTTRSRYPDRWVLVFFAGGRLRAVVRDNNGNSSGVASASRVGARAVKVTIPKKALNNSGGYHWTAFTTFRNGGACARFCVDATKTRLRYPQTGTLAVGRVLHDFTPPSIRLLRFPNPSTKASATLRYRVAFGVRDRGFSGLRRWRLDERVAGARRWKAVAAGRIPGRKRVVRRGAQGKTYQYRVVARDRRGNWRRSRTALITVPVDDNNPVLVAGYEGTWASPSVSGSFLGALHSTSDTNGTLSYTFTGRYTAWIASGGPGTATVRVDQSAPKTVDLSAFAGPRRVVFARSLPAGAHTVTISVVTGEVNVDAITVRGSVPSGAPATGTATEEATLPQVPSLTDEASLDGDGLDCTFPATADAPRPFVCPPRGPTRGPADATGLIQDGVRQLLYADTWHGWPVRPRFRQHPIRGSFLDPRPAGYHFGVDIGVRDDRPEAGAPRGRTHRVYAVEGGVVRNVRDGAGYPCGERRLDISHFSYYHVDATVRTGRFVRPGQMIGWTCKGLWHVHLSESAFVNGARILVNPLHPGGKLRPYVDTADPVIHGFRFFRPAAQIWISPNGAMWSPVTGRPLSRRSVSGLVDVRVRISDPPSFRGWHRALPDFFADHHPYGISFRLIRTSNRRIVLARDVFPAGVFEYTTPLNNHFAPGTLQNLSARACYRYARRRVAPPRPCEGRYWHHLFARPGRPYWNTHLLPDGRYTLRVRAWDARGNATTRTVAVIIRN